MRVRVKESIEGVERETKHCHFQIQRENILKNPNERAINIWLILPRWSWWDCCCVVELMTVK